MAATETRLTDTIGEGLPGNAELVVLTGQTIYEGTLVGITTAGLAVPAGHASSIGGVGKALHTVVGDGTKTLRYEPGVHVWENSAGDAVSAADIGNVVYGEDNETIAQTNAGPLTPVGVLVGFDAEGPRVLSAPWLVQLCIVADASSVSVLPLLASVLNGEGASLIGIEDAATNFTATTVEGALAEIIADYAATTATNGASKIGIQDAGTFTAQTTVETALQEIYQDLLTAHYSLPFSLYDLREVSAGGDVGAGAANGGLLASDTTPILRGDAAETQEVYWAAGNSDIVCRHWTLPDDFDGTKPVTVDIWVMSDNTNADPANFTLETGWDGGALVSDVFVDAASGTYHKITATIAAADIPDSPSNLTLMLTPPAHAADGIGLRGVRVNYARKLRTS